MKPWSRAIYGRVGLLSMFQHSRWVRDSRQSNNILISRASLNQPRKLIWLNTSDIHSCSSFLKLISENKGIFSSSFHTFQVDFGFWLIWKGYICLFLTKIDLMRHLFSGARSHFRNGKALYEEILRQSILSRQWNLGFPNSGIMFEDRWGNWSRLKDTSTAIFSIRVILANNPDFAP